ncbi:MAG: hypothetical protein JW713_06515 [Pontiellaceae bacterium]|nr:hypothetical protein [Pontiellaceae bacterium]
MNGNRSYYAVKTPDGRIVHTSLACTKEDSIREYIETETIFERMSHIFKGEDPARYSDLSNDSIRRGWSELAGQGYECIGVRVVEDKRNSPKKGIRGRFDTRQELEDYIEKKYFDTDTPVTDIAADCRVSLSTVTNIARAISRAKDLEMRERGTRGFKETTGRFKTVEELRTSVREMYHGSDMSMSKVAELCGVSLGTVSNILSMPTDENRSSKMVRSGSRNVIVRDMR